MANKFRPGSEAASEEKTLKYAKIAMAAATVIIMIVLWTVPMLQREAAQTGTGLKVISWIGFIVAFATIALESRFRNRVSDTAFYFVWFIALIVAFLFRIIGGV